MARQGWSKKNTTPKEIVVKSCTGVEIIFAHLWPAKCNGAQTLPAVNGRAYLCCGTGQKEIRELYTLGEHKFYTVVSTV
ncbi:hypothetical protein CJD36_004495 [Flavipsychrobacter stenotrophus]|uniref:Uncharacterized protein n=1 Tax=Flavipsychrobacter stenotrophus TaxID=2077091 RepID=A0A2S7T253_9BACT|nr:hypothetical protein CJD36_004495 [Flavipsychrobacter stenotrophus]